jgi:hypothetical protein
MLLGMFRSDASLFSLRTILAVVIAVGIPGVAGAALLGWFDGGARRKRMEQLRQQTIEAEILKMAMREQGRLTAVEVATQLALPQESAKEALDALVTRDLADIAVSDEGVIVYTFHDAKNVAGKVSARGVLE